MGLCSGHYKSSTSAGLIGLKKGRVLVKTKADPLSWTAAESDRSVFGTRQTFRCGSVKPEKVEGSPVPPHHFSVSGGKINNSRSTRPNSPNSPSATPRLFQQPLVHFFPLSFPPSTPPSFFHMLLQWGRLKALFVTTVYGVWMVPNKTKERRAPRPGLNRILPLTSPCRATMRTYSFLVSPH